MPTQERVALVTGGAQGLGAAIARRLADDGMCVVVTDVQGEAAESLAGRLPGGAYGMAMDVSSDASVQHALAAVGSRFGRLDVLVNNAGVISRSPASEFETDTWLRELDVNLGGAMRCSRAAFPLLRHGTDAAVLGMASVASTLGLPLRLAYSAAKTGLVGLTRTLAAEWGPFGIRVNAVAPGYIDTAMMRSGFDLGVLDEGRLVGRTPLRRLGTSDEVAAAAAFLVSPQASFVTGVVLRVDGGITIDGDFRPDSQRR